MTLAAPTLGILAGRGALPRRIIEACRQSGRAVFVLGFVGQTDAETLAAAPSAVVGLGAAGRALATLREAGVVDVVMAGKIERPSLLSLQPDGYGLRLLARLSMGIFGDDSMLRAIADELHEQGFRVVGVRDVLPFDVASKGALGRYAPDAQARQDIAHGFFVAGLLGQADIGQAVIVQQGIVLGVEAIEGTDALMERCRPLLRAGPGAILVKRAKPQQDERLDLPAVGPTTVAMACRVGLRGVAIEAERTLLIERERLIAEANREGLFVIAVEAEK